MSENGEIYTTGKNFTLWPGLTGWTNSTSAHTAKTTDNTILVHQDHQRAEQIQGQVFPPQRQQLKERQNNSIYTWGLTAEVTSCLDQFQNKCNNSVESLYVL